MKNKNKLLLFTILVIVSARANSQTTQSSNTRNTNDFLGWNAGTAGTLDIKNDLSGQPIDFLTNGSATQKMRINSGGNIGIGNTNNTYKLDVTGDINTDGSGTAFRIQTNKVLWYNTTVSSNIFVGKDAGNTGAASANTFIGSSSGNQTSSDLGYNTCLGYKAGYGNLGSLGATAGYNTYIGAQTAESNSQGNNNTFVGYFAGNSNTTSSNTFVGYSCGSSNTSGTGNSFLGSSAGIFSTGSYNTLVGTGAGGGAIGSTTGGDNSFLGYQAGASVTTGHDNSFLGYQAGTSLTTGYDNVFIGGWAGKDITTGYNNVAIGSFSGKALTSGINNTFLGYSAGNVNTTGSYNLYSGFYAGTASTIANYNTFLGYSAAYSNTTASQNVAVGYYALSTQSYSNTSTVWNSNNVAVGYYALKSNQPTSTTTGDLNAAIGNNAGYSNTTGRANTFLGYNSGYSNTSANGNAFLGYQSAYLNSTGAQNVAVGLSASYYNTTGSNNTSCGYGAGFGASGAINSNNAFFGAKAAYACSTATSNTMIGCEAGYSTTTANDNVFVGYQAGYTNTTGAYNVAIGQQTGDSYAAESNCTFVGYHADANANSYSNGTALGNGATLTASNTIVLGDASVTALRCNTQTILALASDRRVKRNIKENIPGLKFINLLRPVTYNADIHKANDLQGYRMKRDTSGKLTSAVDTAYWAGKYDGEKIVCTGLIAQEVDSAAQQIGYDFQGVYKPKSAKDIYGLDYTKFVMPLIKAVQELSSTVDSLKLHNAMTDSLLAALANCCAKGASEGNGGQQIQKAGSEEEGRQQGENGAKEYKNSQSKKEAINAIDLANNSQSILYQNEPNPMDGSTVIRYFIPENVIGTAIVAFYDMYGKEVNRLELKERGFGKIEANTENLAVGIYSYSLLVDGKAVAAKNMVKSR